MLPLLFNQGRGLKLLCLGAHCDDIEIGCGGTILKMIEEYNIAHIQWVVFTSTTERADEAVKSAEHFLKDVASKEIIVKDFIDAILPQQVSGVKAFFEEIKASYQPDIIFTHHRNDMHQDHRLLNELTWNTFRDHLILEYEIPKYEGDLGQPGLFVQLNPATARQKVQALLEFYSSQAGKHWFDEDAFYAFMRIRGIESASRYAEAFYMRKSIL